MKKFFFVLTACLVIVLVGVGMFVSRDSGARATPERYEVLAFVGDRLVRQGFQPSRPGGLRNVLFASANNEWLVSSDYLWAASRKKGSLQVHSKSVRWKMKLPGVLYTCAISDHGIVAAEYVHSQTKTKLVLYGLGGKSIASTIVPAIGDVTLHFLDEKHLLLTSAGLNHRLYEVPSLKPLSASYKLIGWQPSGFDQSGRLLLSNGKPGRFEIANYDIAGDTISPVFSMEIDGTTFVGLPRGIFPTFLHAPEQGILDTIFKRPNGHWAVYDFDEKRLLQLPDDMQSGWPIRKGRFDWVEAG